MFTTAVSPKRFEEALFETGYGGAVRCRFLAFYVLVLIRYDVGRIIESCVCPVVLLFLLIFTLVFFILTHLEIYFLLASCYQIKVTAYHYQWIGPISEWFNYFYLLLIVHYSFASIMSFYYNN